MRFGLILYPHSNPDLYLEGAATRQDTFAQERPGPRAVLNALERLMDSYPSECAAVQQNLEIAQTQLHDYQARVGAPFPHDLYRARLTILRDLLKFGLSDAVPEPGRTRRFRRTS